MTTELVIFYLVQVVDYTMWIGGIFFVLFAFARVVGWCIYTGRGGIDDSVD